MSRNRKQWKKVVGGLSLSVLVLLLVLVVHIILVTRPRPATERTRVLARFDMHTDISAAEGSQISSWLRTQPGVDNVLCNPETDITVFTYCPLKNNADSLLTQMNAMMSLHASRFMPSKEAMSAGCPVGGTNKVYQYVANIF